MNKKQIALDVAARLVNTPYRWGGNDPIEGFDCSGLIIEILQSVGLFKREKDATAHDLSLMYIETEILEAGTLVFYDWNKDGRIDHVEMIVACTEEGEMLTIGASDGDSDTTSLTMAQIQNAYVKIRPLRDGYVKAVNPFEQEKQQ